MERADCTNSSFLMETTAPRVMRAMETQPKRPSTKTTVTMVRCSLNICMTTMAASTSGIAKKMSVMRERTESIQPPKKPAIAPIIEPSTTTSSVVRTPTATDARAP